MEGCRQMTDAVRAETQDDMDGEREMRMTELRQRVAQGEYTVDPGVVADAILRRARERAAFQMECSYPEIPTSPSASTKTAPGGPETTRPTGVKPASSLGAIRSPFAAFGMQAQSS
jgi:Anti-sigma-28 factor, FlgM